MRVGKNPKDYLVNAMHVRGMRYSEKYLGIKFNRMDYIKLYFIKSCSNGHSTDVFCLPPDYDFPEGYEINYNKTIERLIYMKIDDIFSSLNWDIDEIILGQKNLMAFIGEKNVV